MNSFLQDSYTQMTFMQYVYIVLKCMKVFLFIALSLLYVVFLLYVLLLYCILYVVCFVCSPKLEEIKESINQCFVNGLFHDKFRTNFVIFILRLFSILLLRFLVCFQSVSSFKKLEQTHDSKSDVE